MDEVTDGNVWEIRVPRDRLAVLIGKNGVTIDRYAGVCQFFHDFPGLSAGSYDPALDFRNPVRAWFGKFAQRDDNKLEILLEKK